MRNSTTDEGRPMTDPLLSVNPTTGFTLEGHPTLKNEIRGTWQKLKLSMIFLFSITILAIAILIYGCIVVAQAANNNINMGAALNHDISMFPFIRVVFI